MLMDFFIQLKYNHQQLKSLNRCRIYLQVWTLSDITSAEGTDIKPPILQGHHLTDRRSNVSWPIQQKPPREDWKLWSSALAFLQHKQKLKDPLKDWLFPSHQYLFWFDPIQFTLYHNPNQDEWYSTNYLPNQPQRVTRSTTKRRYQTETLAVISPPDRSKLVPATIQKPVLSNAVTVTTSTIFIPQPNQTSRQNTSALYHYPWSNCQLSAMNITLQFRNLAQLAGF